MEKILRVDNDMARRRLTSVDAYIAAKPRNVRVVLERVRRAIRKAVPRAEERLSYQMSAYTLDGVHVLCFAGWKAHYALYRVNDALVAAFKSELAPYERSKGSIRFPLSEPVPALLIERIARFRVDHGRLALWVPVPNGLQTFLIEDAPRTYFKPPYMGAGGRVGIMLAFPSECLNGRRAPAQPARPNRGRGSSIGASAG
jgi:uncharacterized protein YdhG (YjbR/CyaY superfamily)